MSEEKVSFFDKMTDVMGSIGAKVGNQRHLSTIRDAFATFMPFIIIGAIAIMINSVFIDQNGLLPYLLGITGDSTGANLTAYNNWGIASQYLSPIFNGVSGATMDFFAIYIAFLLGYNLAGTYDANKVFGGMIGLAAFLAFQPLAAGDADGNFKAFLGTGGVLFALLTGLTAPMFYAKISKWDKLQIKMPEGVPPAVIKSFMSLIPLTIVLFTFALIQPVWYAIAHNTMGDTITITQNGKEIVKNVSFIMNAVNTFLFLPLQGLSTSIWAVLLVVFLMSLFWFFGVHGQNIMNPFVSAFWTVATVHNVDVFSGHSLQDLEFANHVWSIGGENLYIWTEQTMNSFMMLGGNAATLGLILSTFIFSKNQASKSISQVSIPSGIFQINEPMTFGLPIMLNPLYMIPYMLINPITAGIAYLFTWLGWMAPTVVMLPWTTPIFVSGVLSTLGWVAFFVTLINFALSALLYTPFVIADSRKEIKAFADAQGVTIDEAIVMQKEFAIEEKVQNAESHVANIEFKINTLNESLIEAKNSKDEKKINKIETSVSKENEKLEKAKSDLANKQEKSIAKKESINTANKKEKTKADKTKKTDKK